MAVSRARPSEIPKDAVVLSEDQAFTYQWRMIQKWENQKDVWILRYAPGILGALSTATAVYINNHYRNKLKLGNYGRLSSYLPIVVLPAMMSAICHRAFVQKDLILKVRVCPVCYETRAAVIQTGFGVLYPTILAPFASLMFATRHYTYNIPSLTEKPKDVLLLLRKMTKPLIFFIGVAGAFHALLGMYITQQEIEQFWKFRHRLVEVERSIEES